MRNSLIGIADCKFFIQFRMGTFPTSVLNSSEMLKDNFNQQAHSRQLNSGTLNSKKLNSNICHISPLIRLEPNLTDLLIRENLPVHQELQENRNSGILCRRPAENQEPQEQKIEAINILCRQMSILSFSFHCTQKHSFQKSWKWLGIPDIYFSTVSRSLRTDWPSQIGNRTQRFFIIHPVR